MSTTESLLDGRPEQPELPGIPDMEDPEALEEEATRNPAFTGERLAKMNPERYDTIVRLWAAGIQAGQIARTLQCSRNSVAAVIRREAGSMTAETYREAAAANHRSIAVVGAQRLLDMLLDPEKDISAWDLARTVNNAENTAQLLGGGPTARVDHGRTTPAADAYTEELARLRAAQPTLPEHPEP